MKFPFPFPNRKTLRSYPYVVFGDVLRQSPDHNGVIRRLILIKTSIEPVLRTAVAFVIFVPIRPFPLPAPATPAVAAIAPRPFPVRIVFLILMMIPIPIFSAARPFLFPTVPVPLTISPPFIVPILVFVTVIIVTITTVAPTAVTGLAFVAVVRILAVTWKKKLTVLISTEVFS